MCIQHLILLVLSAFQVGQPHMPAAALHDLCTFSARGILRLGSSGFCLLCTFPRQGILMCTCSSVGASISILLYQLDQSPGGGGPCTHTIELSCFAGSSSWRGGWRRPIAALQVSQRTWTQHLPDIQLQGNVNNFTFWSLPSWMVPSSLRELSQFPAFPLQLQKPFSLLSVVSQKEML